MTISFTGIIKQDNRKENKTKQLKIKKRLKFQLQPDTFQQSTPTNPEAIEKPTSKDVCRKINQSLKIISPEEIKQPLNFFRKADRPILLQAMQNLTQFGNFESFNDLYRQLITLHEQGYPTYSLGEGTLASNLNYLCEKQQNSPLVDNPFKTRVVERISQILEGSKGVLQMGSKGVLLLDRSTLQIIKESPELQHHLKTNDIKLLYPEGWEEGITMMSQPSNSNEIIRKAQKLTRIKPKNQHRLRNPTKARKLIQSISLPMKKEIQALGLEENFKIIKHTERTAVSPTAKQISENLAPARMSPEQLDAVMNNFHAEEYQDMALNILYQDAFILSPRVSTALLKEKHKKILDLARRKQVPQNNIYYLIPWSIKSYGMVTLQFMQANNISPKQIIRQSAHIKKIPVGKNSMVVVLDDVAGSGQSLDSVLDHLSSYQGLVVLSPMISTTQAEILLNERAQNVPSVYLPNKIIFPFKDTPLFQALDEKRRALYEKVIGQAGYGENGLNVAFPYMSPDNSNNFFSRHIAPRFTFNQGGTKPAIQKYSFSPISSPELQPNSSTCMPESLASLFSNEPQPPTPKVEVTLPTTNSGSILKKILNKSKKILNKSKKWFSKKNSKPSTSALDATG